VTIDHSDVASTFHAYTQRAIKVSVSTDFFQQNPPGWLVPLNFLHPVFTRPKSFDVLTLARLTTSRIRGLGGQSPSVCRGETQQKMGVS